MGRLSVSRGRDSTVAFTTPPLSELMEMKTSMDDELDITSSDDDDLEITHVTRRELDADTRLTSGSFSLVVPVYSIVEVDQLSQRPLR